MNVIYVDDISKKYVNENLCVCIGNFESLHIGHQALIKEVIKSPLKHAMITFEPHPIKALIDPDYKPILTIDDKIRLLEDQLEYLIVIKFDIVFSQKTPDEFIKFLKLNNILEVICGTDFRFGNRASGNIDNLKKEFKIHAISPILLDGVVVKTQSIRSNLFEGKVDKVISKLGRPYSITGKVSHGSHLGKTIGFPTANIKKNNILLPKNGVYATKTQIDGKEYLSMTNIGHNPTFNHNNDVIIETNIFDYDGDLYEKEITILFYSKIREEKKFASVDELKEELKKNQDFVKKTLNY